MSFLGAVQNILMPGPLGPVGPAVMGGSMAPKFNASAMVVPQGLPTGVMGTQAPNPGGTNSQYNFLQALASGLMRR